MRVGILGFGSIGAKHAQAIADCDGLDLAAVVSSRGVDLPGVRHIRTIDALLAQDDIDVIAVCTPSGLHADHALAALKAGKHVVVEKPFTLDIPAGAQVIQEARQRALFLGVISQRRFEPACSALAELIGSGATGRPLWGEILLRWRRDNEYYGTGGWRGTTSLDGGVLMNQGIHLVDLLRWFFGPVALASSTGAALAHDIAADDTAVGWLRFESDAMGVVIATTAAPEGHSAELNLFFERGEVALHDDRVVRWTLPSAVPERVQAGLGTGATSADGITHLGHLAQWNDIVRAIRGGVDPLVTGEVGLATAAVVVAMQEAGRAGMAVRPAAQAIPELASTHRDPAG